MFWAKELFEHGNTQIILAVMQVFSYGFGGLSIVHFLLFEVAYELCLNEGRYCNKRTPLHLCILKVFTSCYWGKEVLQKVMLVLEKSLLFSQKILCEPCVPFYMYSQQFTLCYYLVKSLLLRIHF